jgi:hypothetical protein
MKLPIDYDNAHWTMRKQARDQYCKEQKGNCYHCGENLDGEPSKYIESLNINTSLFPQSFFKWPVHLHHDHKTGLTIGAIHSKCNAVLWQYHGE